MIVCCLMKTCLSCVGHMPTNCLLKYANIISWLHTHWGECEGRSIPSACFFSLQPSLSTHSRKHTKCCPFFHVSYSGVHILVEVCSFQIPGNEESVTTFYQIFYRPLSPHDNIKLYTHSTPALLKVIIY